MIGFWPLTIAQLRGPDGTLSLGWMLGTDIQLTGTAADAPRSSSCWACASRTVPTSMQRLFCRLILAILEIFGGTRIVSAVGLPLADKLWVNAVNVTDLPDAPCVVPHHDKPKSMNFVVRDGVVVDEILSLFRYMSAPDSANLPA